MTEQLSVGVDIGGTKVAAGVVDADGRILAIDRRPTPSDTPEDLLGVVADMVTQLQASYDVATVGVGAAGFVDVQRSRMLFAPNLVWRDAPIQEQLGAKVGVPVVVENDANAAAWGEHRFGAGTGRRDLIVITLGTGIGAGLVIDGELHRGHFGIAGEPGHMRVVPDGRPCGCGNRGCWEQYCSGKALVRAARELATERPGDATLMLELAGGDVESIDGPVVTEAARSGDEVAVEAFAEVGRWLGQGLADLAAILDPDCFVIGGGLVDAGELLFGVARESFAASLTGAGWRPIADVLPAVLGPEAGLIGAADLARRP